MTFVLNEADDEICGACGELRDDLHFDPCVCIRCVSVNRPSKDSPLICAICDAEITSLFRR